MLITGARKLLYLHSRFRNIPRFLTAIPGPEVEMHPDDAAALGVADGDTVAGHVADRRPSRCPSRSWLPTRSCPGSLQITHGWKDANVNLITHDDRFDPISGFPLMKSVEVRVEKAHRAPSHDQRARGLLA